MSNRNKIISAQAASTERAAAVLAGHVDWRKWPPTRQIDYLFSFATPKELYAQVGFRSVLGQLYENCVVGRKLADQKRVELVLRELAGKRTELLLRPEAVKALGAITKHYRYRVRELADWVPKSKNVFRQLESLVRHLFDQYGDVPAWVLNAWLEGELLQNGVSIPALTVHVGSGQALRSFTGLPVPLTRKLEHEMRQAPAGCTLLEALRYAQLALRGALAWHGPVLESRLGREAAPEDNDFWLSVVDFFATTPMVDSRHFGPVCDWIYQKRTVGIAPEPAQPNFSLKGRSMVSVLAQTERWHRTLAQTRRHTGTDYPVTTTWAGLLVPNFAGSTEDRVRITQLHTFEHLIAEGRALNHCVASYVGSCLKGRCGIFSVTIDGARALTLEVSQSYVIVQARGKHNRPMTADERFWVAKWATKAHLTLSKHV
ncbi:MAG: PcfJ domain-containing protein [Hymenobacter sp.]|nr:PcfJ domain-containing protein [Hymenobacter sp.]